MRQFYEEVDNMKVIEALDWLIAKAREKGYKTIVLLRSGAPKGFLQEATEPSPRRQAATC